ncbi:Mitochondrial translation elongation factor EF-Tsmt, catalyzes nucleotide exchange on EF-Tumt [Handroanthus impetiginosus]|uniref:Elongation factor Ts, mitochondrial n=1 Tax=Handroanthus impetiginosus TaxID=429701 RepID=A0A2G9GT42_9LAMI|nr:Mitochondrial translation elongation factor EF-Tsmt, catalyzes nucleotide exchange on EF-Tumt [Handroanthus impetiginosus]
MAPVMSSSTNGISLTPDVAFITKKRNFLSRCSIPRKPSKQTFPVPKYTVPLSTSIRLFPQFRIGCVLKPNLRTHIAFASGTDVAVEEADLSPADDDASETPAETSKESSAKSDVSPTKSKRPRPVRKSEMPPVKNEELIPGATFTGKVRSIQPFGAFVDFGAFTDGLVHVSRLSNSYVQDVASVVTVGQEVTVRLVEANLETGRISLSMRESDDTGKLQQQSDADKSRPSRRTNQKLNQKKEDTRRSTKFVKGQQLEGTVKNITRAGAFISLPEGEEGFLPTSEEADEGFVNMKGGGSSLEMGQEVSVRVLRINRGQVTLTMKKEEDLEALDAKLNQGVVHTATNPFVLAFRSNEVISAFLEERENKNEQVEKAEEAATVADTVVSVMDDTSSKVLDDEGDLETLPENSETKNDEVSPPIEDQITEEPSPIEAKENKEEEEEEAEVSAKVADLSSEVVEEAKEKDVDDAIVKDELTENKGEPQLSGEDVVEEAKEEGNDGIVKDELTENVGEPQFEEAKEEGVHDGRAKDELIVSEGEPQLSGDDIVEEVRANAVGEVREKDEVQTEITDSTEPSVAQEEEETAAPNPAKNDEIEGSNAPIEYQDPETESAESPVSDNVGNQIAVNEVEQTSAGPQQNGNISNPSEKSTDASPQETVVKAAISPALVKQLREETGAGMMDCKKALSETGGDIVKAQEYLRKKGLASADKKASRVTAEGRIGSYIHDSRIGVLIEVNCETDFVARGDIFKELVEDLTMQVAACPQVEFLNTEDVPKEIVDKGREIEMQKEDLLSKPEQIRSKIVDGRIRKRLEELSLLDQPFIKDDKVVVKDWVKQTISTIGENIKVKRFVRYNLGEGLEKKSQDFAAEVAAQTAAKPVSTPVKQEPAETKETAEPPKAVVSAALVKQLREETGAGMMDCKKALSETGGDLEKAQEYLRKKGLSTAEKKSSRLAAEGRIGSYIHDSRIGVLIEVNCETDFVGRSQNFKELVDDLAMQVVACPQVQYVSIEDIPESIINKEKELEMQREDLQSKPENIREKIVEGRVTKRLGELALLEQPFIKNDSMLVKDLVKQTVAALGENLKVRRFVRFTLGETTSENEKNDKNEA